MIQKGKSLILNGGADRDRTDDLLNAIYFQVHLVFYKMVYNA
jgi:hypothetical protein